MVIPVLWLSLLFQGSYILVICSNRWHNHSCSLVNVTCKKNKTKFLLLSVKHNYYQPTQKIIRPRSAKRIKYLFFQLKVMYCERMKCLVKRKINT